MAVSANVRLFDCPDMNLTYNAESMSLIKTINQLYDMYTYWDLPNTSFIWSWISCLDRLSQSMRMLLPSSGTKIYSDVKYCHFPLRIINHHYYKWRVIYHYYKWRLIYHWKQSYRMKENIITLTYINC